MQRYNPMTKCLETVKTTDSKKKRTADKGIFVKKVHKSVKSALGNTYYIVEDDRGAFWVTTDKTGNGGGTMEFSMANAVKTLKDYLKMDELEKKYGKQEGYKKWMRGEDRKTVDAKTFYSVTYYVMGRGKETKFFDNPNDAMKFYNKADRADKPKKLTYSNPQKIKELEEYIREQNAYSRYY